MDFFSLIEDVLLDIWSTLKSIALWFIDKVFIFSIRIKQFFLNLFNKNKTDLNNENIKAVAIKVGELLKDKSKYNEIDIGLGLRSDFSTDAIMTTTFNIETGELDADNAQIVEFETLDRETKENFGDKPLLILK